MLSSSGWVPMLTSDPLWTTGSFAEFFIRQRPSYSITLWAFPWIHNAFGKLYPLLSQPCSASSWWFLLLKLVVYISTITWWVEHMPSLKRVNPKVFTSHTLLVLCQIKFQHYNFLESEKWMKGYTLEKWESTLNFMFMPMDTLYIFSSKLLLKLIIPLI